MQKIKKLSIYDLNPRFFKDYSGDGMGDLRGLSQKFDYFDYLGVDAIILQDVLASHGGNSQENFTSINKEIGDVNDLTLVLSHAKKHGIKIFLEMKIGSIKETHKWFQTAVDTAEEREENIIEFSRNKEEVGIEAKYNKDAKAYFPIDTKTREIPLNWKSDKVLDNFVNVIKFWNNLGVEGFVFKEFEFIGDKTKLEIMNEATLKELRKFYRAIKEINDDIIVVGKSQIIQLADAPKYTDGSTKVFDYFQSTRISMIGTYNKYGKDAIGKFTVKKLVRRLQVFANNPSNIVSFGSENIGRFLSRWGDEGQYTKEAAKAFAIANILLPASSTTYYADELGARNIGLTHLDDFQDATLEERKIEMAALKITEREFMDAQVMQNPINARSLMMWNSNKNGGFSTAEKTVTPVSNGYVDNNVEVQFGDENSVLNFYKELNRIITKSTWGQIITKGQWSISTVAALTGVVKMTSVLNNKEVVIYINLTDSVKRIIGKVKAGKVVLSSYADRKYTELPKKLDAFEAIVISKHTDEYIKETQIIKIQKTKELEAEKLAKIKAEQEAIAEAERLEQEKTREIELKKQQAAQKRAETIEAKKMAQLEEEQAKLDAAKEKEEAIRRAQEEKLRQEVEEMKAKERAEQQRQRELQLEEKLKAKAEAKEAKLQEKTRIIEMKKAAKAEKEAAKQAEKSSILHQQIDPSEITTLTEDQIAETTQIDVDDIDDIEEFLNNSK